MSKKRNRSIKTNFKFPAEFLHVIPEPDKVTSASTKSSGVLENKLKSKVPDSTSSSDCDNTNSESSDFDIVSYDKTSSSSVSWCDDFDTEATQRVQNEFERMERVLQGLEKIPSHYNVDEYKLWMKTFPELRISGIKPKLTANEKDVDEKFGQVIPYEFLDNYNPIPTSLDIKTIDNLKSSVIDEVFERVSSRLFNNRKQHSKLSPIKVRNRNELTVDATTNHFGDILRITPTIDKPLDYLRQQSSNSISRSEISSSKWMQSKPDEYSSLPYLANTSAKGKPKGNWQKNAEVDKSRSSSKLFQNRSNCVVLPPIKTNSSASNQFRSISATPRRFPQKSSAVSLRIDSNVGNRKFSFKATDNIGFRYN